MATVVEHKQDKSQKVTGKSSQRHSTGVLKQREYKVALMLNIHQGRGFGFYVPISLLYLGTQLKKAGHSVMVLDRRTYSSDEAYLEALRRYDPGLVGICLYADGYTNTYKLVNAVRRFGTGAKVVLGGPEVSASREYVVGIFDNVDYFLAGEAEYTMAQLANCLAEGADARQEDIAGLSFRQDDGEIIHHPAPEPVKDVDTIDPPDRDLISPSDWKKWYYRPGLGRPSDTILTSRGCPFTCRFCYRMSPGYRGRSPENVLAEMEQIHARGAQGLFITDDNFTINQGRCVAILEGIIKKGWRFAIKTRGRVNRIDPELLRLMKRAGVHSISFGIESGSQQMLDAMDKRTTVEQNYQAIRMVVEAGIQCYADMIVGFPGETPETIQETSDFLMKAKPTGILIGALYPLHSTDVFDQARKDGTLIGDWGLLQEPPWVKLPWTKEHADLVEKSRQIKRRFYMNPGVIFRGLKANVGSFRPRDYVDVCGAILRSL